MEDYMRELDPINTLLFAAAPNKSPLHPTMKKAYGHLYRFVKNHMTVHEFEEEPVRLARIAEFREELLAFCRLAEKVC